MNLLIHRNFHDTGSLLYRLPVFFKRVQKKNPVTAKRSNTYFLNGFWRIGFIRNIIK